MGDRTVEEIQKCAAQNYTLVKRMENFLSRAFGRPTSVARYAGLPGSRADYLGLRGLAPGYTLSPAKLAIDKLKGLATPTEVGDPTTGSRNHFRRSQSQNRKRHSSQGL